MLRNLFYFHSSHYFNVKNALLWEYFLVLSLEKVSFLRGSSMLQEKTELFIVLGIQLMPGAFCIRKSVVENIHLIKMNRMTMETMEKCTKPNHFLEEVSSAGWILG